MVKSKIFEQLSIILFSINIALSQTSPKAEPFAPIYSIYYETDKWNLTTENTEFLNSYVIQKIQSEGLENIIIHLEGHTDDVGNSDYNIQLSQKRVQEVYNYLISKGLNSNQLTINYFGESKPETRKIAISKKLNDIRYANRRVIIKFEKT
ncbi:MAG TPA: OmpA family protein [Flavobacterium sp.]|uniref:OmpA family protein n=1 Tax=Flavobacterium sp. TaxID=239 RepID=UPI002B4AD5EC|nr:OmpA family protein [Flavobacterium sp.]HLO72660.1 OmpA family protein [Flavobacterium sp.]